MEENKIAMQARCIYCKMEQYAPAVHAISYSLHPCVWCGKTPPQLTWAQYTEELNKPKETINENKTTE